MRPDCIIVLAKQPLAGFAKTRLAVATGPEAAAVLAEAFLLDTLDLARGVAGAAPLLAYAPPSARDAFAALLPDGELAAQPEGDLGARLDAAFRAAFASGAQRAVVIATDSPSLPRLVLVDALRALGRHEVVLGPADDGGYYLLGMNRCLPRLFERIDWSTDLVCRQTLARTAELELTPFLLPPWYDVDDASGLERLQRDLDADPSRCPHTRAALDRLRPAPIPAGAV